MKAQKEKAFGLCRGCGAWVRLLDDGKVRVHRVTVCVGDVHSKVRRVMLCAGTYRTPKERTRPA